MFTLSLAAATAASNEQFFDLYTDAHGRVGSEFKNSRFEPCVWAAARETGIMPDFVAVPKGRAKPVKAARKS